MTNITRDAFEAWAVSKSIDITKSKDAWGNDIYQHPHVDSMWFGWQAATEQGKPQPLRGEQIHAIFLKALPKQMLGMDYVPEWAIPVARAIEAAHGITATPQGNLGPPHPQASSHLGL